MKEQCVLPDGKQYVQSVHVGADNSIEGFQNGYTHMAVSQFKSVGDRDYYVKSDPVHITFGKSLGPVVKGLQVLDIEA
ncbi:Dabb family protein [Candidatus Bathyarchaeota archaeon]|nr:Dabb family protein [Candidatus Bathyarchaeota archaeon]